MTRENYLRTLTLTSLGTLLAAGCARQVHYEGKTAYYQSTLIVEQEAAEAALDNQMVKLVEQPQQTLHRGGRVALFPPDSCATVTAAPEGAEQAHIIQMRCGVLLSKLERQLGEAGYEVVSWQSLRPGLADGRVLDRAEQLGIDTLLEIDQFSINARMQGTERSTRVQVFAYEEEASAYVARPIEASKPALERCLPLADELSATAAGQEVSATLAIKIVEVPTGRSLAYYTKTQVESSARPAPATQNYYYASKSDTTLSSRKSFNDKQRVGAGVTAVALPLLGLAGVGVSRGLSNNNEVLATVSGVSALTLAPMVLMGVIGLRQGNKEARAYNQNVERARMSKQNVDDVLCVGDMLVAKPTKARDRSPKNDLAETAHQLELKTRSTGASDPLRRQRERLEAAAATDFVSELTTISGPPRAKDNSSKGSMRRAPSSRRAPAETKPGIETPNTF